MTITAYGDLVHAEAIGDMLMNLLVDAPQVDDPAIGMASNGGEHRISVWFDYHGEPCQHTVEGSDQGG